MSERRQADTIEDFVVLWTRSQLATQDEALEQLRKYKENFLHESQLPDTITAFCTYLVSVEALSPWQCQKLRNGQWKGFFLDEYEIVDHIGRDSNYGYYLARDLAHLAYVRLAVAPSSDAQAPQIQYHLIDELE